MNTVFRCEQPVFCRGAPTEGPLSPAMAQVQPIPHYPPILLPLLGLLQRSPRKQAWLVTESSHWAIAATEGSQLYRLPTGLTHISYGCVT